MRTRSLGRTSVRLSEVALGTWGLSSGSYGAVTQDRIDGTVLRALESGVTTFDVGRAWGSSERAIARLLGSRRDDAQIITRTDVNDAAQLVASCEASLNALVTDRIDVWLLNHPDEALLRSDALRTHVATLKDAGKVLSWGVSVSDPVRARLALTAGADVLCIPYNLLASDLRSDLASDIALAQAGVLARTPLAYGLLAGSWQPDHVFVANDHRVNRWTREGLRERIKHVQALQFLVHGTRKTLADAAIAYVLADSDVATCIVGARSPAQIADAARLADGPPYLDESDLLRIPQVLAALGI